MATRTHGHVAKRPARKRAGARLTEAEATLDAIRTGQVDAIVVRGPRGEETRLLEGAMRPYFVLLDAMNDGAALLEAGGRIIFGNRWLGDVAGARAGTLRGLPFRELVARPERPAFDAFLRGKLRRKRPREFTLSSPTGSTTPVAIALSSFPAGTYRARAGTRLRDSRGVMAIIMDLTRTKAEEATRAELLQRLISAEDDERRRVARELHDETGQSLAALLIELRALGEVAISRLVKTRVKGLRGSVRQLVDDIGRLSRGLHPAVLDDQGLAAAARRYVHDYTRSYAIALDFRATRVDVPTLPALAAATTYRILQETLTNVARHARAKRVMVALTRRGGVLTLTVTDDGRGFITARMLRSATGLGLHGMRERASLLGGSLDISSTPGAGTTVRARIPVGRP